MFQKVLKACMYREDSNQPREKYINGHGVHLYISDDAEKRSIFTAMASIVC